MDVRLPAALSLETNELVDAHEVARGRDCNCVCPSCGQGVQARQGDVLFWHFAHDPNSPYQPTQVCEISFTVVAKKLAIQLMLAGEIDALRLPEYVIWSPNDYFHEQVTQESKLEQLSFSIDPTFDLVTSVKGHLLFLCFDKPGKVKLEEAEARSVGLLQCNLAGLEKAYIEAGRDFGSFSALLKRWLERQVTGKSWLSHPRVPAAMHSITQKLKQYEHQQEVLNREKAIQSIVDEFRPQPIVGVYICKSCRESWQGYKDEPYGQECQNCRERENIVFRPTC